MSTALHPPPDRLAAFARGELPPHEQAEVETHVAGCDVRCSTLKAQPAGSLDRLARQAVKAAITTEMTTVPGGPPELFDHPRYRVTRQIGAGGMGVVYLAEHKLMGRTVALKVMARKYTANSAAVDRFRREVRAAARLAHPNIVTAHDADEADGLHFLVMEYVEGVSLDRIVSRRGPQPVAGACHVARLAAQGLQHAFEKGMVHRDVKPHNLMVTRKGQVKILDFGLARLHQEADAPVGGEGPVSSAGAVTSPSLVMGTPDYLSPEQARNSHAVDIRADIYSLGCTLYFLLTGRPPFAAAETAMEKMLAHLSDEPPPVRSLRPEVPEELAAVLGKMMAKDPAARYATPADVAQSLLPFTKPGVVLDAEPLAAGPLVAVPVATATPAPFAFDPDPQDGVGTEPVTELTTDRLPAARPKRRRKRKGKVGPSPWVWAAVGLAVVVAAIIAAAAIRSALKTPVDSDRATTARGQPPATPPQPLQRTAADAAPAADLTPPPAAPARSSAKVLFVIPSNGLFYQDYGPVRKRLEDAGVTVESASSQNRRRCFLHPSSEFADVTPEKLVTEVKADDYDGVIFAGGNVAEFTGGGFLPASNAADRIVTHMKDNDKVIAAICGGQPVLLRHFKSTGLRVAESPHVERKYYIMSGANPVADRVVALPERVITAATAQDGEPFVEAILKALGK
jgi:serine/threonine-protein kinase